MEYGLCVAGEPLVHENKRATAVRPPKGRTHEHLLPVQEGESGDLEAKDESDGCGAESEGVKLEQQEEPWSKIADKVEELQTRLAEQLEIENDQGIQQPPMIKAPIQPTREQWERHQTTHTPYEPWCPHCVAARAVRRNHPNKKMRAHIVLEPN